jgi:glycogen synthase
MKVSVIINTLNRVKSLLVTLEALQYLDHEDFEVVVVNGPSSDGTSEALEAYAGRVKLADCPEANLSRSRNIGIALAAGDVVAFLDDDAYPEAAWLDRIVDGYDEEEVAAVGGPVLDHSGIDHQVRFLRSNRFGGSEVDVLAGAINPSYLLSVPGASHFPSILGTNSSFRRSVLTAMGGFDEEYEYFLDETDVCVRLVDAGYVVRSVEDGFVHHKFLPNSIRKGDRIARSRYSVIKNSVYFALRHGPHVDSFASVCDGITEMVRRHRVDMRTLWEGGLLDLDELLQFEADVARGSDTGFRDAMEPPRTRPPAAFDDPPPFLPFPRLHPHDRRLHLALVTREHPPGPVNGVGRIFAAQARALAGLGHVVHVVTEGGEYDKADFESGVWVHRTVACESSDLAGTLPAQAADWTTAARRVVEHIDARRPLDAVVVPSWDSEGLAFVADPLAPTVVSLVTPLPTVLRMDAGMASLDQEMLDQLLAAERRCLVEADLVLCTGPWSAEEFERGHGLQIPDHKRIYVPYALPDLSETVAAVPAPSDEKPRLLFVGRLEPRKGIDVLLACLPNLLDRFADLTVILAGEDVDRSTEATMATMPDHATRRVRVLGRVPEDELLTLYAECDIVVVPSRYESFGLVLLEAMMFGKAVVAARVGGIPSVVADGVTGLLVAPGDSVALGDALAQLIGSRQLRKQMGGAARERYCEHFDASRMADRLGEALASALAGTGQVKH